jgi:hypothetical protein
MVAPIWLLTNTTMADASTDQCDRYNQSASSSRKMNQSQTCTTNSVSVTPTRVIELTIERMSVLISQTQRIRAIYEQVTRL